MSENPSRSSQEQKEHASNSTNHSVQWQRQGEWLAKLRNHKQTLEEKGLQGWDLWEAMASLSLNHKIATLQGNRCPHCWHDPQYCICSQLKPIQDNETNLQVCILMHHKEYLGAGNSAKLLFQLLPNHTQLYLFGKEGELDRLQNDLDGKPIMVLWPAETALSVEDYYKSTTADDTEDVYAIVLDGTYTQARNMYKSLRKQWRPQTPFPHTVVVNPTLASVFHRAQKNYGKAHLQQQKQKSDTSTQVLRVSTAEACGVLWSEWEALQKRSATTSDTNGSSATTVLDAIVQAVVANNKALAFARRR